MQKIGELDCKYEYDFSGYGGWWGGGGGGDTVVYSWSVEHMMMVWEVQKIKSQ